MSVSLKIISRPLSVRRPNDPALLTREEAATFLGVSVSSLAHWSMAGTGPVFIRVGRRAWYREAHLRSWMADQVPARMGGSA
ncbi:helix-turn-helix transcriptional regulator [Brevundimonas basaltis]